MHIESVTEALEEEAHGLCHLLRLLIQHHPGVIDLHPGAVGGVHLHVEADGGLHMGALLPHNVEDRNLEAGPGEADLPPTHIGLEEQSEVSGAQL